MDLLGTWGKRTQDWLGGARRSLLGEDLPPAEKRAATVGTMGPGIASQMQGLDTAQRAALAGGGVRGLMQDPAVAQQATDLAGQLDLLGPIKAYHGTPHTFLPEPEHPLGRFRMDKLGTGEGAQAYGHGLYFAESPKVAGNYRDQLSHGALTIDDRPVLSIAAEKHRMGLKETPTAIHEIADVLSSSDGPISARAQLMQLGPDVLKQYDDLVAAGRIKRPEGSLYEVELGLEHEDLLDWDLPLSKQPPKVREAIQPLLDSMTEERLKSRRALAAKFQAAGAPNPLENVEDVWGKSTGQQLVNLLRDKIGSPDAASRALREAGIPGIRYLDAGSRGGAEGTRNVVLFDDALARIQGRR